MILPTDEPTLYLDRDHRYWIGRENLIGVSEVLKEVGLTSDEWFTETHSSRGRAIHAELANIARGHSPFIFLDPDLVGWVQSGIDFLAMLRADGAEILGVEVMAFHPIYRFCGTMDLVVRWRGYDWVLDIKSGKASPVTRFQISAYDILLGPTKDGKPRKRAAVEIHEDGSRAKIREYNTPEHFHDGARFLAYLTTARDKRLYAPGGR